MNRELWWEFHKHWDEVDKDMQIYDMTGIMDIPSQNAHLIAMTALLDQLQADCR